MNAVVTDPSDSFLLALRINNIPLKTLVDSGATHCFIDSTLVSDHCLPTTLLPHPMCLHLFDGLYAPDSILYEVSIPIYFSPSKTLPMTFLVTLLNSNISAVIRLHWLCHHNLLVNWVHDCIEF